MIAQHWGTTSAERSRHYPCQDFVDGVLLTRGVDVQATGAEVFRWLCQLSTAPYSYDLLDNFGRRSPRRLIPGLEHLEVGQTMCRVFTLRTFEQDRTLTMTGIGVAMTYEVQDGRLLGALTVKRKPVLTELLAIGDLVMMRKQLRTFAELSRTQPVGSGVNPR